MCCSWVYTGEDPYAIHVVFHDDEEDIPWTFARELANEGLEQQAGIGDVQFSPGQEAETVALNLESLDGSACFTVPRPELVAFLRDTYRIVPEGHESAIVMRQIDEDCKNFTGY